MNRPEVLMPLPAVERQQLLQAIAWGVVNRVALGNTLEFDGVHSGRKTSVTELKRGLGAKETGDHQLLITVLANREDCGVITAAPKRNASASRFATGQPRKLEAALIVDWFYALPPSR